MYTAYIGRRLLDLYNAEKNEGSPLTPEQFFDSVFFPLVFDDERYLMLANNSKFDQAAKQKKRKPLTAEVRNEALAQFHHEVKQLKEPHGHLYLGGSAREVDAATSSQVTSITIPVSPDEIYLSWMGAAAGIGVKGGFSMLLDNDQVLLALVDGWVQYRKFLTQLPTLKPYQIETWNGWWIIHRFSEDFKEEDPLRDFPDSEQEEPSFSKGQHAFNTPPWIRVIFALANKDAANSNISYVYSFGQTNTTIGFIRLDLPKIDSLLTTYERIFGTHDKRNRKNLKRLYETQFGFVTACQQGSIGLKAIEPKNLRKYMPVRYNPGIIPKKPKKDADEINFQIYQTWIIAMLNNDELLKKAQEFAEALHTFTKRDERGKQTHKTLVNKVLKSQGIKSFISALTEILEKDKSDRELLNNLVMEVIKMPKGDFPLFLVLIQFKYASI